MKKLYFIINPQARNGYSKKVWEEVEKELVAHNISFRAFFSEACGHATEIARTIKGELAGNEATLIVVGGDGTFHEVMNGIVGARNIHVGFIPSGSGNDFRRGYDVPKDPISALNFAIERSKHAPTFVDVGEIVDGKGKKTHFINNMGVGFDALISKEANASSIKKMLNKISLGNLIYAYFVIQKVFSFKRADVTLTVDGVEYSYKKAWFVTIANQPFYGGGMKIAPQASPVDGEFNITVVQQLSRIKFLLVFLSVFWGGHVSFKEVKSFVGKDISIQSNIPLYVHADGECIGETPVAIKVKENELPLLTKIVE